MSLLSPHQRSVLVGVAACSALALVAYLLWRQRGSLAPPLPHNDRGKTLPERCAYPNSPHWIITSHSVAEETRLLSRLADNPAIVKDTATLLSREELVDRIKGTVWGQAIGDAIGLSTENMDQEAAQLVYGEIIKEKGYIDFGDLYNDFHRQKWASGDWTDDTDQMLCILQSFVEERGHISLTDIARRIQKWANSGFEELGDVQGRGIGITVGSVVNHPHFTSDPLKVSREVWELRGRIYAANGGAMRTSLLGVFHFDDLDHVDQNAASVCRVTHFDPRSVATAVAVSAAIAALLQGETDVHKITLLAQKMGLKHIHDAAEENEADGNEGGAKGDVKPEQRQFKPLGSFDEETANFVVAMNARTLAELHLDDRFEQGFAYKLLGASFWALRSNKGFMDDIMSLVMAAGDADTNCAASGALLGAKYGYSKLPRVWLNGILEKDYLTVHVNRLLVVMGLKSEYDALHEMTQMMAAQK